MFSGIVEEMGTVQGLNSLKNLSILKVRAKKVIKGTKLGASIAVDGACLTVVGIQKNILMFDIMRETLLKTTLGSLKAQSQVNLERALRANSRIDGHFVTGHIDSVGVVKEKTMRKNYIEYKIGMKKELSRYIVPKGSVCLDGVSLTIGEVRRSYFSVYLIPFTKKMTTLGAKKAGDRINIETDILAKYLFHHN